MSNVVEYAVKELQATPEQAKELADSLEQGIESNELLLVSEI